MDYYQTIKELDIKGRFGDEEINKIGLPVDLHNKSVLDIGCNIGAYCIECKKRNAVKVIGIEPNNEWRWIAIGIADELKLDIKYDRNYLSTTKFDLVLLLSVLHLVENPQKILDDAWNLTEKLLIVEINDRLQEKKIKLPIDKCYYGKSKDNRSVYHFIKNNK